MLTPDAGQPGTDPGCRPGFLRRSVLSALRVDVEFSVMTDFVNYFFWPMVANVVALSIIGVAGWYQFRKQHLHTLRMDLFSELMGQRYNLKSDAFTGALNRVLVLFDDDLDVVRTARDLSQLAQNQTANNQDLVNLFRAICRNLGISEKTITDHDFTTAFNVQNGPANVVLRVQEVAHSPQPQLAICGYHLRDPNPATVTVLDVAATQQLIAELQRYLESRI